MKKKLIFYLKIFIFFGSIFSVYLNRHVFVLTSLEAEGEGCDPVTLI